MKSNQLPVVEAGLKPSEADVGGSARIGYWRSVGQLEGSADYEEFAQREFRRLPPSSRRGFRDAVG